MRYLCIVNLVAGKGGTAKIWPTIKNNLERLKGELIIRFTQYSQHAQKIAQEAKNLNVQGIIIVGGDGTVNEVINGLEDFDIPLGVIPTGSGNDLTRTLCIPRDPLEAIITIAQGKRKEINIGQVDGKYFANVASVGFDAAVANWVNNNKVLKGSYAYMAAIFYNLLKNNHYKVSIKMDNNLIERECTLVAIANGKYYGAGQKIAPKALMDDNLFDVVIVSPVSRIEILKTLPTIKKGHHTHNPHVSIYRAREVTIDSLKDKEISVQADGEILTSIPKTFRICDKRVKVFVP